MGLITYNIQQLYDRTFGGKPYVINGSKKDISQISGSALTAQHLGKEIWLPIKFVDLDTEVFGVSELLLPYTVIKLSANKTIINTPLADRKGSVKELYSIDDYQIDIKGFAIDDKNRIFPEQELITLNKLFNLNEAVKLDNVISNIFLDQDTRVVIKRLDLPEVEGGRKHIKPFTFQLESDSIFTLELDDNV